MNNYDPNKAIEQKYKQLMAIWESANKPKYKGIKLVYYVTGRVGIPEFNKTFANREQAYKWINTDLHLASLLYE